jgi:uncharacterized OB-fold protein
MTTVTTGQAQQYAKPLPRATPDSEPYWRHLKEHRLHIQRCSGCGSFRMYPRPMCDRCYSFDAEWVPASGRGTVYSWGVVHQPVHPAWREEFPFAIVEVELEEGVRLRATMVDVPPEELSIGMPVEIAYDDVTDEVTLPRFRRAQ